MKYAYENNNFVLKIDIAEDANYFFKILKGIQLEDKNIFTFMTGMVYVVAKSKGIHINMGGVPFAIVAEPPGIRIIQPGTKDNVENCIEESRYYNYKRFNIEDYEEKIEEFINNTESIISPYNENMCEECDERDEDEDALFPSSLFTDDDEPADEKFTDVKPMNYYILPKMSDVYGLPCDASANIVEAGNRLYIQTTGIMYDDFLERAAVSNGLRVVCKMKDVLFGKAT